MMCQGASAVQSLTFNIKTELMLAVFQFLEFFKSCRIHLMNSIKKKLMLIVFPVQLCCLTFNMSLRFPFLHGECVLSLVTLA